MPTNVNLFKYLSDRGLVHNSTPNIEKFLIDNQQNVTPPKAYCGFDPSGKSLQVGNLVALLLLRRAQLHGVKPLALLGGATGLIGDPSGKKAERSLLDLNTTQENIESIKKQISQFIDFEPGKYQAQFVNNYDWFKDFNFIQFLRDVGKHITVNYMIAKDSVKLRMETGISYAEFGYMLMQGYDYLHLYENHGCLIQLGGSDQWGNITTGIELIRRKHGVEAHAASCPLLTDAAGNKLGKTENGAVYLDPQMTTPFQFFQYWLQRPDSEVIPLLKALTLLDNHTIESCEHLIKTAPEKRDSQKVLAKTLTDLVHGQDTCQSIEEASQVLFSKSPETIANLSKAGLATLAKEVPSTQISTLNGLSILDLLINSKMCESKGEARRHIQGNAVTINRTKITDDKLILNDDYFKNNKFILLGLGKTQLHLVIKD